MLLIGDPAVEGMSSCVARWGSVTILPYCLSGFRHGRKLCLNVACLGSVLDCLSGFSHERRFCLNIALAELTS